VAIRDQLFAEAVVRFGAGEKWYDIPGAADEQEKRYQVDSWQDHVGKYLENRGRVTMTEIMEEALFLKIEKQDRGAQTRVGAILRRMGWRVVRENSGNRNRYYEKIQ
jgi:predicted P-loop ATPase